MDVDSVIDTNYKENVNPYDYIMKPYNIEDDLSMVEVCECPTSIRGTILHQQGCPNLDHHILINGSSSNQAFDAQTPIFDDPFDPFSYGSPSKNLDFYETKPFVGNGGMAMQNFQASGLSFMNDHMRNNHVDMLGSQNMTSLGGVYNYYYQDIKQLNFVVPDEMSCIRGGKNGFYKELGKNDSRFRAPISWKKSCKEKKISNSIKGQWTSEEDRLLIQLVQEHGLRKWSFIAQVLPGRVGKQCRERWHNHLRPNIKKDTWSEEEDRVLIQTHMEIGNKWAEIAKRLPGRTENSIKNHWNATKRRQFAKRRGRSKNKKQISILQKYIMSLDTSVSRNASTPNNSTKNDTTMTQNDTNIMDAQPIKMLAQQNPVPEICWSGTHDDRLVPNFDFDEVPDFDEFDPNMFEDSSMDSLLEDITGHNVDEMRPLEMPEEKEDITGHN